MQMSMDKDMSDDTKDLISKVQSWEKDMSAIFTDVETNVNHAEKKLGDLEQLVQEYRKKIKKAKSSRYQQQPPDISEDSKESKCDSHLVKNLQLIYHDMSPQLKLCLLSLPIFPKDSIIKKRSSINWWIGESLVSEREDKMAEQVGEEVYEKLIKQGLIEPDDNNPSPHMNRLGFFYFNSKDETSPEVLLKCPFSSSRLPLLDGANSPPGREPPEVEDRSMAFNVNQKIMKKLTVLQLGWWMHSPNHHIEFDDQRFLNDIGVHHRHLKFLSLQGISRITCLPDSIVQLVSLEILDLRACHNLEELPEKIASLKKLTHLDVSECYLIELMPKETEKLCSLQVLKGFVIGTARKNPCKISDLGNLTKLRWLSTYIGRGAAITDKDFASLKDVASLCYLTASWGVTSSALHAKSAADWDFPQQLGKLKLIDIPEKRTPDLKNVRKLYIIGRKVASLDPLQQIDSVEILRLKHLKELRIGNT
ncbi:hypothetical protein ACJRO7_004094 [Eucalyptus globulus]|uniref:Disease resistance RPP13-like protein 4 n=1 Tax=Eucalyptus globulus TaxID=34317 RepID=A0ABD3IZ17_EUCGL